MARLYAAGAEENSTTTGVEIETSGTISVVTTPVLTGTYAWRFSPAAGTGYGQVQGASSDQTITAYVSAHFRFASFPSSGNTAVIDLRNSSNTNVGSIVVTSGGTLQLLKSDGTQIGSYSSALSTNTWYCIQMSSDASTSPGTLEGKLDGTSFASGSNSNQGQWTKARFGAATTTTADIYVDDFIFNDSSGSFCNTYPSINEKVIVIRPDSNGDNSAWTGTYADVDEVTPNDNTDYISSTTLNQIEEHNYGASGLGSTDTIVSVSLNVRQFGPSSFSNTPTAQSRIKASSGGTVETGFNMQPGSNWGTNQIGGLGLNHIIVTYDLPGASTTAWTYTDVDALQAGAQVIVDRLGDIRLSTLWVTVTYTPQSTLSVNVSDTVTLSETVQTDVISYVNQSDSTTVSETIQTDVVSYANVTDSTTVSETVTPNVTTSINVTDTVTVSETVTVNIVGVSDPQVNVSDSTTLSETVNLNVHIEANVTDTVTVSETINEKVTTSVNVTDTVTVSETVTVSIASLSTYNVDVSDTVTVSETVTPNVTTSVSVTDTATVSETINEQVTSFVSVTDTATVSETVTAVVPTSVNVTDTVTVSETVTLLVPTLYINVSDTVTVTETVTASMPSSYTLPQVLNLQLDEDLSMGLPSYVSRIAFSSGAPTGSPNGYLVVFDYVNNDLYIYNQNSNSWKSVGLS